MATDTTLTPAVAIVRAMFEMFAAGDLAAFSDRFHPGATWNHRNDDRFGGVNPAGTSSFLMSFARSIACSKLTDHCGR